MKRLFFIILFIIIPNFIHSTSNSFFIKKLESLKEDPVKIVNNNSNFTLIVRHHILNFNEKKVLWSKYLDISETYYGFRDLAKTSSGYLALVNKNRNLSLIKFSSNGNIEWKKYFYRIDKEHNRTEEYWRYNCFVRVYNGKIYVILKHSNIIYFVKLNSYGDISYYKVYELPSYSNSLYDVKFDKYSNLYLLINGNYIVKLNSYNGNIKWIKKIEKEGYGYYSFRDISINEPYIYLTGYKSGKFSYILKIDTNGNKIWGKKISYCDTHPLSLGKAVFYKDYILFSGIFNYEDLTFGKTIPKSPFLLILDTSGNPQGLFIISKGNLTDTDFPQSVDVTNPIIYNNSVYLSYSLTGDVPFISKIPIDYFKFKNYTVFCNENFQFIAKDELKSETFSSLLIKDYPSLIKESTKYSLKTKDSDIKLYSDSISFSNYCEDTSYQTSTTEEKKCSKENLSYCTNENDCKNANGYWYNNKCNSKPQKIGCTVLKISNIPDKVKVGESFKFKVYVKCSYYSKLYIKSLIAYQSSNYTLRYKIDTKLVSLKNGTGETEFSLYLKKNATPEKAKIIVEVSSDPYFNKILINSAKYFNIISETSGTQKNIIYLNCNETKSLGIVKYYESPKIWKVHLPDKFSKVEIGTFGYNQTYVNKYGGWSAYLKINNKYIWKWTSNGYVYDYTLNKKVKESSGYKKYLDVTKYFDFGYNTITYYHYTEGDGIGVKVKVSCEEKRCSKENLFYCKNENDCKNANGYWYNNKCNSKPQETTCSSLKIINFPNHIESEDNVECKVTMNCNNDGDLYLGSTIFYPNGLSYDFPLKKVEIKNGKGTSNLQFYIPPKLNSGKAKLIVALWNDNKFSKRLITSEKNFYIYQNLPTVRITQINKYNISNKKIKFKVKVFNYEDKPINVIVVASIIPPNGKYIYDLKFKTVSIEPKKFSDVEFYYSLDSSSPHGIYKFLSSLWVDDTFTQVIHSKYISFNFKINKIKIFTDKKSYSQKENIKLNIQIRFDSTGQIFLGYFDKNGKYFKTFIDLNYNVKDGFYPIVRNISIKNFQKLKIEIPASKLPKGINKLFLLFIENGSSNFYYDIASIEISDFSKHSESIIEKKQFNILNKKYEAHYYSNNYIYPIVYREAGYGDLYKINNNEELNIATLYAALINAGSTPINLYYYDENFWEDEFKKDEKMIISSDPKKANNAIILTEGGITLMATGLSGYLGSYLGSPADALKFEALINLSLGSLDILTDITKAVNEDETKFWKIYIPAKIYIDSKEVKEKYSKDKLSKTLNAISSGFDLGYQAVSYAFDLKDLIAESSKYTGKAIKFGKYSVKVKEAKDFVAYQGISLLSSFAFDYTIKSIGLRNIPFEFKKAIIHMNMHYKLMKKYAEKIYENIKKIKTDKNSSYNLLLETLRDIVFYYSLKLETLKYFKKKMSEIRNYTIGRKIIFSDKSYNNLLQSIKNLNTKLNDIIYYLVETSKICDESLKNY